MKLSHIAFIILLQISCFDGYAQSIESIEVNLNEIVALVDQPFFGIQHHRNTYNDPIALSKLKELDLTYVRFFADPEQFNPSENEWDWSILDQTISELRSAKYEPIPAIFQAEDWDISSPDNPWWNNRSNWPRWQKAIDSLVARYAEHVQWWILFDEINYLKPEEDYYMSFQTSTDLYIQTAKQIRALDEHALIGGPTGFSGWENGHWASNYVLKNEQGAELLDFISSNIFLSWDAEESTQEVLNKTIWFEEAPLEIRNRLQSADDPLLMLDAFNFSAFWTLNGQSWTDPRNTSYIGGITQTLAYLHALKGGFDFAFRWETLGGFGILRWFPNFEELPTYYNYRFLNQVIKLEEGAHLLSITTTESPIENLPHHSTQKIGGYNVQPFAVLNESSDSLAVVLVNKTSEIQKRAIFSIPKPFRYNAAYSYQENRAQENCLIPLTEQTSLDEIVMNPYSIFVAQFTKEQITSLQEEENYKEFPNSPQLTNYPNPFNPTTYIVVELKKYQTIEIEIYTLLGQKISTIAKGVYSAGTHRFEFNAQNLPSGVYLYQLKTLDGVISKRMTLMK